MTRVGDRHTHARLQAFPVLLQVTGTQEAALACKFAIFEDGDHRQAHDDGCQKHEQHPA